MHSPERARRTDPAPDSGKLADFALDTKYLTALINQPVKIAKMRIRLPPPGNKVIGCGGGLTGEP